MPQFVLLLHECPTGVPRPTHWDLMLQVGGVLRTWVLHELPREWSVSVAQAALPDRSTGKAIELDVEEIQPHRLNYLHLEGPLTGNRGLVRRIDRGPYEAIEVSDGRVRVRLAGDFVRGTLELTRRDASTPFWRLSLSDETTTST